MNSASKLRRGHGRSVSAISLIKSLLYFFRHRPARRRVWLKELPDHTLQDIGLYSVVERGSFNDTWNRELEELYAHRPSEGDNSSDR